MRYAFPDASVKEPVPPSAYEFVKFNTLEFLRENRDTNQESVVKDAAAFKQSASQFVQYLSTKKNESNFEEIFCKIENFPQLTTQEQQEGAIATSSSTEIPVDSNPGVDNASSQGKKGIRDRKRSLVIQTSIGPMTTIPHLGSAPRPPFTLRRSQNPP